MKAYLFRNISNKEENAVSSLILFINYGVEIKYEVRIKNDEQCECNTTTK